jgi:hypothetical protein
LPDLSKTRRFLARKPQHSNRSRITEGFYGLHGRRTNREKGEGDEMEGTNFPGAAKGIEVPTGNSETRPKEEEAAAGEAVEETGGGAASSFADARVSSRDVGAFRF